ncbi:uncharacterized protein A4U43_C08F34290 [Asparagus officinalis]|nr:uncharacterized protein A4U43_C08F34290 [Asparagus officinalis]
MLRRRTAGMRAAEAHRGERGRRDRTGGARRGENMLRLHRTDAPGLRCRDGGPRMSGICFLVRHRPLTSSESLKGRAFNDSRNLFNQHHNMRADVDSVSYEELLALEERIGNEAYKEESVGRLACRHDFHSGCIKEWWSIKKVCPICKASALPATLKKK